MMLTQNDTGVRLEPNPGYFAGHSNAAPGEYDAGRRGPANGLFLVDQMDGGRTGALTPLAHCVFDGLPLTKLFEGNPLHFRMVEEQVIPLAFNKSKTTIRYQALDLTLWHFCPPEKNF